MRYGFYAASDRLDEFAQAIAKESLVGSETVYAEVVRAHAGALMGLGRALTDAGQPMRAADAYATAAERYTEVKDPGGIGRALVYASLHVLQHPRIRKAEAEHALDLLRFGVGLLEEHRVGLRSPQLRSAVARHDEPLHDAVLDLLLQEKRCPRGKKAELALWLMESRRRAARDRVLADPRVPDDPEFAELWEELQQRESGSRIPSPQDGDSWYERWEAALSAPGLSGAKGAVRDWVDTIHSRLPAPAATDVSSLLRRAGDGVVLALRTRRDRTGWTVDTVTASVRGGISLHRSFLRRPADGEVRAPDPVTVAHSGALTLDALEDGDRTAVRYLTRLVESNLLAWKEIASSVLPPGLEAALAAPTVSGRPPVLLVVPDGPVASLPLAGLPLSEHALLGERALVTCVPALALLREPVASASPSAHAHTVAVHLDRVGLHSYQEEERLRENDGAQVVVTTDRRGLFDALRRQPAVDLVLISAHGEAVTTRSSEQERLPRLADDTPLSAATALGLPWPQTVVLGTCWVNRLESSFGSDPVSFPMSCLLRGAATVIGPSGPFHDAVASKLFGGCAVDFVNGADVWTSLFDRMQSHLRNGYGDPAVPAAGAGVAFWTVQPPVVPIHGTYRVAWDRDGVARNTEDLPSQHFRPRSGNELSLVGASSTLVTALRHAAASVHDEEGVVDTLGLALSIAVTDPVGRWDDFFQAPGSSRPLSDRPIGEREPTTDIELPDGLGVVVTASAAAVLHLAKSLCHHLQDEYIHTQHVMYGLIHAVDSNAHAQLGFAAESAAHWQRRLSEHAFVGAGLPVPSVVTVNNNDKRSEATTETLPDDVFWALLQGMAEQCRKALLIASAVAALVLGLFLQDIERVAAAPSLGVEFWPVGGGYISKVGYIVPGGPADKAGLHVGDFVPGVGPFVDGKVGLIVSAPPGTALRRLTLYPVVPRCLVVGCSLADDPAAALDMRP